MGQATPRGSPSVWAALQSACPGRKHSERKSASPRLPRLGERDWRVSTLHRPLCLNRQTDTRSSAARRIGSGAAGRKRRAASQSSELREERPLLGAIFESPEHSQTRSVLERAPRSQVAATHSRGGEPFDLGRAVGNEIARNAPRSVRAAEVIALVSTPPRLRTSGPGIPMSTTWMRRLSSRGGVRPRKRSTPCGGLKIVIRVA